MANLFNKNNISLSSRQQLESRYATARGNLLIVVCFSVINMVLMIAGSDTYFLFSAFIPYILTTFGMMFCGKLSEEWYVDENAGLPILEDSFLYTMVAIAVIFVILYLISWFFSKKRVGWLIFALVFFGLDTLGMLAFYGFAMDSIIDIVFHVWVIVSLSMGISAYFKLKKLPSEEEVYVEQSALEDTAVEEDNA